MRKISKNAFVVKALCSKYRKPFGITVDKSNQGYDYDFVWGFPIKEDSAKREGYDTNQVNGSIAYDPEYNGCPHCGEGGFVLCGDCHTIVCHAQGGGIWTCPSCGNQGELIQSDTFDLTTGQM